MPRTGRSATYDKIRIHVYLRRPRPDGYHHVRMVAYFHGTDFSVSPGLLILPVRKTGRKTEHLFEPKTGRVLPEHPEADAINAQLAAWDKKMRDGFRLLAGPLGSQRVSRDALDALLFAPQAVDASEQVPPGGHTLQQHYQQWASENAGLLSPSYLENFGSVANQLAAWRPEASEADFNERLVRDWHKHLLGLGRSDGTISNHYKYFRMLAARLGLSPKMPWLRFQEINSAQLDLTRQELHQLLAVRLPAGAGAQLRQELDRWLLQCLSGRRAADMPGLQAGQLSMLVCDDGQQVPVVRHHQQKTTGEVLLPLPPLAMRIGQRWNWQLPAATNRVRNRYIKELAQLAGLTRLFNDAKVSGGKVVDNYRPAWELIGTHTTRHTAGSLLLEVSGGDQALAGYVLGHTQGSATTGIYAKDKARRVAGPLLAAWKAVLGEYYDADLPAWAD